MKTTAEASSGGSESRLCDWLVSLAWFQPLVGQKLLFWSSPQRDPWWCLMFGHLLRVCSFPLVPDPIRAWKEIRASVEAGAPFHVLELFPESSPHLRHRLLLSFIS